MTTGLDVFAGMATALQIVGMIYALGRCILDKSKDINALRTICADGRKYIADLEVWETAMGGGGRDACRNLRKQLEEIIGEIDALKGRGPLVIATTCLKLYKPDFREKFSNALEEFKFHMCLESKRLADKMDEKLRGMAKSMEEFRIAFKSLGMIPNIEDGMAKVYERIERLTEEMQELIKDVRLALNGLENADSLVPQFERIISTDGGDTREIIMQTKQTIVAHLIRVEEHLTSTNCITRIKAEIVPESNVDWYDDSNGPKIKCRLWSFDQSSEKEQSTPDAVYAGLELSAVPINRSYDDVLERPAFAEDVDNEIRERKSRRVSDRSRYVGLARRGKFLYRLDEYSPIWLRDWEEEASPEIRTEAVRIEQALGQEYRYFVRELIQSRKDFGLPELRQLAEMERAMLIVYTGKFLASFIFLIEPISSMGSFFVEINVSWYDPIPLNFADHIS